MAKLTAAARRAIPASKFALPGGRYPIEDKPHARNALSRVSANGTPEEKARVRRKVHEAYPEIGVEGGGPGKSAPMHEHLAAAEHHMGEAHRQHTMGAAREHIKLAQHHLGVAASKKKPSSKTERTGEASMRKHGHEAYAYDFSKQ